MNFLLATRAHLEGATRVLVARQTSTAGSAQSTTPSASALYVTLVPVLLYACLFFGIFLLVRSLYPRIYAPRTFIDGLTPQERSPALPKSRFGWFKPFFDISDTTVLNTQSLDGFLFLRFLKISVVICLVGCLITWPILFPINATGSGGQTQLNILTYSNAASAGHPNDYYRYFAHAICAYIFYGFILYMITRESLYFISLRQAYLISPLYADRISSRTVLFTSVPRPYLDVATLRELFGEGVMNIWIAKNTKELEKQIEERDKIAFKLESAENSLIRTANGNRTKAIKEAEKHNKKSGGNSDQGELVDGKASTYLDPKKRPTHRLKFLIGKKVDTIDWCREQLSVKNPAIQKVQEEYLSGKGENSGSCFVEFETLRQAQSAFQSLTHHAPLHMAPRYIGKHPKEIIWKNLRLKWWERVIKSYAVTALVVVTIIFWSLPVAFVGFISNLPVLITTKNFTWLSFITALPKPLYGLITGLLPSVLLSVLMSLLPPYLKLLAKISGQPTYSDCDYAVQNYYFGFQVVQVFLVTTLSSGAIAAAGQIAKDPSSVTSLLAENLPKASNFYYGYIIVQGLGAVSQILLAITGLVIFLILGKLLDKTPRKKYNRWFNLVAPSLGTSYPIYTNFLVIAIAYSCIAPLLLGFFAIGLWLFYFCYRYKFLFVYNTTFETKGLMYPRALGHLFIGLYISEICLIGLFAIAIGSSKGAIGPLVLMIIFLIFTVLYQASLNTALGPLLQALPKTLETEERRLLALDDADADAEEHVGGNKSSDYGVKDVSNGSPTTHEQSKKNKPNFFIKWLRPDIYTDYYTLRKLVPRNFATIDYDEKTNAEAYLNPAVSAEPPILWIPTDTLGISKEEVAATSKVHPISDKSAVLTNSNDIDWNHDDIASVPIFKEKIHY